MKIISSYKVRLQDNSNALATTAAIYQEALSLLIEIAEAEWAYLNRRKPPAFRPGDIRRQMALLKYICRI